MGRPCARGPRVAALIWCPFADEASAAAAASLLLDEGLVACANIFPPMRSLYTWKGERGEAAEVGVLFKTDASALERATARLAEIHPYDTPAVLGWRIDAASGPTAEWLRAAVGARPLP
jgi:periplasmic divalent cation tolerance protein